MLFTFLKIALRHYGKHRLYALLNLLGLATAYLTVFLIGQYLYVETHYEHAHPNADRIYRITHHDATENGFETHWARTYLDFINDLPEAIPEISRLIRFHNHQKRYLRIGTEKFRPKHSYLTDPEVFEVFGFELLAGDPQRALAEPFGLVLTESMARRYFGDEDPMGQTVEVVGEFTDQVDVYTVRGIMADPPPQTHLPVEVLLSFPSPEARSWWAYAYVLLASQANSDAVAQKVDAFVAERRDSTQAARLWLELQPLTDIHLHSHLAREIVPNGDILYVRIFVWVAILVLLIALVNSLNLSAALALGRGKEVGLHLVMGASRAQLFGYALIEVLLYHLLAAGLGLAVGYSLLPALADLMVFEPLLATSAAVALTLGLAALASLAVGWYPARVLSRAPTQLVFRQAQDQGAAPHQRSLLLRRLLVGLQFATAFLLMGSAWVGQQQLSFLQNKQLGMDISQVIGMPAIPHPVADRYQTFRSRLLALPGVEQVAACMEVPSREIRDVGTVKVMGSNEDPTQAPRLDIQVISPNFLETMQIELLAGEDRTGEYVFPDPPQFSDEYTPADYLGEQPRQYLINETGMRSLGWERPEEAIGKQIQFSIGGFELAPGPITGVVADVHQESLRNRVDPTVMVVEAIWLRTLLLRVDTRDLNQTIAEIETIWDEMFPAYVMEFSFLDELYDRLYRQDRRQISWLLALTGLAVLIALLGLFSLLAYALQVRMKELAIRRIVGASWRAIIWLLGKEYLLVLLIGAVVALPLSYRLMRQWLANFAYRVEISPSVYAFTLLILGALILATVAFQTLRNGRRSPAQVLREG